MYADPKKMAALSRPELVDFHGVSMTHYFTDNWENVQSFQARPDDILIATYPKAGTTWVSYILDLLYFGQTAPERQTSIPIYDRVPFLEMTIPSVIIGFDQANNLQTSPRLIKTHYPVQFVPKSFWEQNCKMIYVARNAKDNAVSYFHFNRMNMIAPEPGDWSSFLQKFIEGKMLFGPWYDHVNNWWRKKQTYSNLHYMFYEDMIEDTGREIDKLCSFLGLSPSVEEKQRIIGGVQFDNMKKNDMANYSTDIIMDFKISPFMRKGKVGDWKNHFTVAQNEEFDEDYKRQMKDPTLKFRTVVNLPPRPELFDFHGVSMSHIFTDNWEKVQNFQARPDDILIATYPKAGTTWVSYILDLLHFGQTAPERQTSIPIDQRVPFLEIHIPSVVSGVEQAINLPTSPRLIKTHFPVQFVPKSFWEQNCKMIYVARNAKDNVVSYFHFDRMNMVEPEPGDWSSYLQRFMKGKMVFGSWYDHVNGWWKKKQTYSNIHYMFYEDMIEDTGREIDNLCSFLGLSPSVEERQRITGGVQFDNMKKNDMANYSTVKVMDFKVSPFMRKGKAGDWKNHFTVAQNEEFDEDYKRQMKDPTLKFRTVV
ncbi:uncharacterized protein V6R79_020483 [Siganus canaliculatus]